MSIKAISPSVVKEVLEKTLQNGADTGPKEDSGVTATQKDQYVRLSVNLQRTMGLFDFSTSNLAADPLLIAAKCDGDFCDTDSSPPCDCITSPCDDVRLPCDDVRS